MVFDLCYRGRAGRGFSLLSSTVLDELRGRSPDPSGVDQPTASLVYWIQRYRRPSARRTSPNGSCSTPVAVETRHRDRLVGHGVAGLAELLGFFTEPAAHYQSRQAAVRVRNSRLDVFLCGCIPVGTTRPKGPIISFNSTLTTIAASATDRRNAGILKIRAPRMPAPAAPSMAGKCGFSIEVRRWRGGQPGSGRGRGNWAKLSDLGKKVNLLG